MKNPLLSVKGTLISGIIITIVLVVLARVYALNFL
jgi:hypothetical protein